MSTVCPPCSGNVMLQHLLSIVVRKEKVVCNLLNNDFIVGRPLLQSVPNVLQASKVVRTWI